MGPISERCEGVKTRLARGLRPLAELLTGARSAGVDRWRCALSLDELRALGATTADVRLAADAGLVELRSKRRTRPTGKKSRSPVLALSGDTQVVLSDVGAAWLAAAAPPDAPRRALRRRSTVAGHPGNRVALAVRQALSPALPGG